MKKLFFFLLLIQPYLLVAQSSRNGYWFTPRGTIRTFIVLAEALNDPKDLGALDNWQSGQMPPTSMIDDFVDTTFTSDPAWFAF